MKKYKSKNAWFSNKQAQVFGERIEQISRDGRITPQEIVKDAQKKNSPFHSVFEWNNDAAANQWRLQQARILLNSIEVIYEIEGGKEKAYSEYLNIRGENREYIRADIVMGDDNLRGQFLLRAMIEARGWMARYEDYRELAEIFNAIKKVEVKIMTQ